MPYPTDDPSPLRVDVIGADRRLLDGLQSAFIGRGRSRYLIVNATVAEALIVDLSDEVSAALWADYRREFPGRPTVVLSQAPVMVPDGCELLLKPLDLDRLFEVLDGIRAGLQPDRFPRAAPPGHRLPEATALALRDTGAGAQDADATTPLPARRAPAAAESTRPRGTEDTVVEDWTQATDRSHTVILDEVRPTDGLSNIDLMGDRADRSLDELEADPGLYLATGPYLLASFQSALKAAVVARSPTRLDYQGYAMLIDPATDRVHHRAGSQALVRLCEQPVSSADIEVVTATAPGPKASGWKPESVTATLWRMALWTYRGRLPQQTDVQSRMYLAQWPNFTRLLPLPNALRIAALWTEQPMPMTFTAEALRIPQRNVFAFYSAAYTIGLSGQARRSSDRLFQPGALSA